jgi:hypothetical protein
MELDLEALASHQTIQITTTGRRSVDGRFIITGTPGRRDWMANLYADPRLTIHVRGRDIPAIASPVRDAAFRRSVFTRPQTMWYSSQAELDHLVATAPMVEIHFAE